jgi:hypothetical protein
MSRTAKVVPIGVERRSKPQVPSHLGQLKPSHALLVALDLLGDHNEAFDAMLQAGFKEMAVAMTWMNAVGRLQHVTFAGLDAVVTVRSVVGGAS